LGFVHQAQQRVEGKIVRRGAPGYDPLNKWGGTVPTRQKDNSLHCKARQGRTGKVARKEEAKRKKKQQLLPMKGKKHFTAVMSDLGAKK